MRPPEAGPDRPLPAEAGAGGGTPLEAVLRAMPCAGLLLDGPGRPLLANPPAESLLRARDGLEIRAKDGHRPVAALPAETRLLTSRIARALTDARCDLPGPVRVSRPSGRVPLLVSVVPLPPAAAPARPGADHPRVLLLVIVPDVVADVAPEALCSVLGFTHAEARVALLISTGLGVPQAAAALGLSPTTVKTHLSHCFEKTGLHSQIALARLVGGFPGPWGDRP